MEYDGELYQQPRVEIRPEPLASFRGRTFASAVSPESMEIMARMGVGLMVIAQKPWETTRARARARTASGSRANGTEAPKPILVIVAGVSKDPATVERMREVYLQRWARSTVEHYEFDNIGFAEIEGYEYYGGLANNIAKHGLDKFNGFLADLQVWGTPEQVDREAARVRRAVRRRRGRRAAVFGGMPAAEAAGLLRPVRQRGAPRAPAPRRRRRPRRHLRRAHAVASRRCTMTDL